VKRGIDLGAVNFEIAPGRYAPALTSHEWRSMGLDFAIVRCGNGNAAPDAMFVQNMVGARTAGLVVGAYHVVFPLPDDGINVGRAADEQARRHFMQCGALGQLPGTLPVMIDAEWPPPEMWAHWGCSGAQILDWLRLYLRTAEALYGRTPLLYTYPDWWRHVIDGRDASDFAHWRLALADYSTGAENHTIAPWPKATLVQYMGGGGTLARVGSRVDQDEFTGSDAEWDALLAG